MRILVIEDDKKHLSDGKHYSQQLTNCTVDFATTLEEAMAFLEKNNYGGAISDVFFPAKTGASAKTFVNAIIINKKLIEMGVHHVFNTARNHHGGEFEGFLWKTPKSIHNDCKQHFLMTGMIIEEYRGDSEAAKGRKQWQAAFRYILLVQAFLQLPDKGESILQEIAGVVGLSFPYGDYGKLTDVFAKCSNPFVVETFRKFNT